MAQLGGPDIFLNSGLINPFDTLTNEAVLMHEVFHNVSGLTDPDIQRRLGLSENAPSDNITQKLKQDCKL